MKRKASDHDTDDGPSASQPRSNKTPKPSPQPRPQPQPTIISKLRQLINTYIRPIPPLKSQMTQTSPLLSLPLEVRLQIWTHVFDKPYLSIGIKSRAFTDQTLKVKPINPYRVQRKGDFRLDLLSTCKQIRSEATPCLQRRVVLWHPSTAALQPAHGTSQCCSCVDLIPLSYRAAMRYIMLPSPTDSLHCVSSGLFPNLQRISLSQVWFDGKINLHRVVTDAEVGNVVLGEALAKFCQASGWPVREQEVDGDGFMEKVDFVVVCYYLDMSRERAKGWEVKIDTRVPWTVISTQKMVFKRRPLSDFRLWDSLDAGHMGGSGGMYTKKWKMGIQARWRVDPEAWTIVREEW